MKKNFKLVLALVLAAMMIVGSFSAIAADTAPETADATITVSGLDNGDKANFYRVLEWVSGDGWRLTDAFNGDDTTNPVVPALSTTGIDKAITPVAGEANPYPLSKADLEAITNYVKDHNISATTTVTATNNAASYDTSAASGLYLVLVEPTNPGIVYNPIVVSSDYKSTNATNEIDASHAVMGASAVAKKEPVTVLKTEPKITNDINDTYSFNVTTTIPAFAESFVNPYFTVSDTMSSQLQLDLSSVVVKVDGSVLDTANTTGVTLTATDKGQTWTLAFGEAYLDTLTAAASLEITYDAKLVVNDYTQLEGLTVEQNEVTIKFPNNPKDDSDKSVLKDGTREYTFTIDGNVFGNEDWFGSEVIKVGLDKDSQPIESVINTYHSQTPHAALNGATFQLYTKNTCTDADKYSNTSWDGSITTGNDGRLYMPGLDAGTYYLKELSAPAGYIKDTGVHTIVISADIDGDDAGEEGASITEYWHEDSSGNIVWSTDSSTGTAYTYKVPVLRSWTVTVDGHATTYNVTLTGPTHDLGTIRHSDAEIVNTKGVELPSTGGIGTTIFYIGGSILVLAAAILLITKRRMSSND